MKSYLSLIPISARVHKRRNRMTLFCIIIAVFLVTSIFSMADMGNRCEQSRTINHNGKWHIKLMSISEEIADQICSRSDVATSAWFDEFNPKINDSCSIGSKKAVLYGAEKMFYSNIMNYFSSDIYPHNNQEIILTSNAKDILGVNIGDRITIRIHEVNMDYIISGFCNNHTNNDIEYIVFNDAIGVFMNMTAFDELNIPKDEASSGHVYYVQFKEHSNIKGAIADIKSQYDITDENIDYNTLLLGTMGLSDNTNIMSFYYIAAVLFILILIAGVLMIAGSINSNISERSQFFGMMRCIGATRKQIIHFVRLEALNWCKIAVPAGVSLGIIVTWGLCAVLRSIVGGEFSDMPVFEVSGIGIISGIIVGMLTVLLAAQAPAKHAARVSPVAAVSGNSSTIKKVHHAANTRLFKIETALGVNRALSAKKNLILMTGSFALSIILFLCFSVVLNFIGNLVTQLRPDNPDLSIMSCDRSCSLDNSLITEINDIAGVKHAFGRMYRNLPAAFDDKTVNVDLISYDSIQIDWAKEDISCGDISKVYGNDNFVLTVFDKSNSLIVGDKIKINETEMTVAGVLSTSPFSSNETPILICSDATFTQLTGENNYAVIDIQLKKNATNEDVNKIRNLAGNQNTFSDRRSNNKELQGTYWVFTSLVYGFLAIIAMITVFYIINSISMSVSARIKQYGAMRAVGMDGQQVTKMIAAEAFTYAISGCFFGCLLGLPLNYLLFSFMVTSHWGQAWSMPVLSIIIILLIVLGATAAAVYIPSRRIKNLEITDTINEL